MIDDANTDTNTLQTETSDTSSKRLGVSNAAFVEAFSVYIGIILYEGAIRQAAFADWRWGAGFPADFTFAVVSILSMASRVPCGTFLAPVFMLYRSAECIREPWLKKSLQENIEESIEEIPCVKNLPALPDYIKRRADLAIDLGIPIAVQFLATQLLLNQHGNFPLTATGLGLAFLLSLAGAVGVLHKGYQCYQEGNFCPMFQSKPKQDNVLVTNLLGS